MAASGHVWKSAPQALILSEVEGSGAGLLEAASPCAGRDSWTESFDLAGSQLSMDTCLRRCRREGVVYFGKPASSFDFAQDEAQVAYDEALLLEMRLFCLRLGAKISVVPDLIRDLVLQSSQAPERGPGSSPGLRVGLGVKGRIVIPAEAQRRAGTQPWCQPAIWVPDKRLRAFRDDS